MAEARNVATAGGRPSTRHTATEIGGCMTQEQWTAVDRYIAERLLPADPELDAALADCATGGLPPINVAPNQGKLLHLLAVSHGARTILEIGTLGGYSTIWLARALPEDGHLVTLEIEAAHAEVARRNLARAGLAEAVEVRLGPALDALSQLVSEGCGPFDMVFIDADKPSNPAYFEWALRLSRPGTMIVVDNVVRNGRIIDPDSTDPDIVATLRLFELMAAEPRVTATAVQTVGGKGYDGFILALVTAEG